MNRKIRGVPAVPQTAHDAAVHVVAQSTDDAAQHHHAVGPRLLIGLLRHPDQGEQRPAGQHAQQGQGHNDHQQGAVDGVHRAPHRPLVPGAHILGDHDGRAHGESEEEGGYQEHDREARAHGGEGGGAHIVAHHHRIHHVVELLEHISRQQGQGEQDDQPGRRPLSHVHGSVPVPLDLTHCLSSPSVLSPRPLIDDAQAVQHQLGIHHVDQLRVVRHQPGQAAVATTLVSGWPISSLAWRMRYSMAPI